MIQVHFCCHQQLYMLAYETAIQSHMITALTELAGSVSVARVRPRTSKGITDLLLPQTSVC